MRVDTEINLLQDSGYPNEVALATDTGALVLFNGTIGGAKLMEPRANYGTWVQKPLASEVPVGTKWRATDVGTSDIGTVWASDGAYWRPDGGRQLIYQEFGSLTSPLAEVSGNNLTLETYILDFDVDPLIRGGILAPGSILEVELSVRQAGSEDGIIGLTLAQSASNTGVSNSLVDTGFVFGAGNNSFCSGTLHNLIGSNSYVTLGITSMSARVSPIAAGATDRMDPGINNSDRYVCLTTRRTTGTTKVIALSMTVRG